MLRSGLVIGLAGLLLFRWARAAYPEDVVTHRTLLLSALVLLGVTALLRALTDGEERPLVGDRRFRWLAVGALPVYALTMYWGPPARFFRLAPLGPAEWGAVLAAAVPAFLLCKLADWWARRPPRAAEAGERRGSSRRRG